jgi:hypothetical protein
MVALPSTGALRYHNFHIDGFTSLEYFEYTLVWNTTVGKDGHIHMVIKKA